MKIRFVDLPRQNNSLKREILPVIERIIDEGSFTMGKNLEKFEKAFAKFCNKKYAIGLNSGTDALKIALLGYGIGEGDEVIIPANGYFSLAQVILEISAKPILIDVAQDTYTIDTAKIESVISKKTKAIVPVHLYGQASNMDEIFSIAEKYKLLVIEDACQAHGASYKGKMLPVGETGAFSFYPSKNLGGFGDGGAIVTNSKELAAKAMYVRNDGSVKKYIHPMFGVKSRLDTLQSAILSAKLPYLRKWNNQRRKHAALYTKLLSKIDEIALPIEAAYAMHVYHIYAIETDNRDTLQKYLKQKGIETLIHYPIPIHLQGAYKKEGYKEGDFPIAEEKAKRLLSLPMFPELTEKEIRYVCKTIEDFFRSLY